MIRPVIRRLLLSLPLFVCVTGITFVLEALTPGNVASAILGTNATRQSLAALRRRLGLDDPFYVTYWHWLTGLFHGNMGRSLLTGSPVAATLNSRLPVTLSLIIGALVVAGVLGVLFGVASAVLGGIVGRIADFVSLVGLALPTFWVGYLLVLAFAVELRWFPAIGYVGFAQSPANWARSLVLPVFTLSIGGIALIARQTRDAMLDTLAQPYVRSLRARGIPRRSIIFKHALRNALPPVLTLLGLYAVSLLLGTIVVETIFSLPGIGSVVVGAVIQHDVYIVAGASVYFTVITLVVFTLVDLVSAWANPKLRK
jgi:peptide/nickel transport system permease protein